MRPERKKGLFSGPRAERLHLCYAAFRAADILPYDSVLAPEGEGRRQQIEIGRDMALRSNHLFGTIHRGRMPILE